MSYLKLKSGVILRKRVCKFKQVSDIIAMVSDSEIFSIDTLVFRFLSQCDGTKSLDELTKIYQTIFGEEAKQLEKEIVGDDNLNQLIERKKEPIPINKNQIVEVSGMEVACRNVIWHLTSVCNLKCKHCYYVTQKFQKKNFTLEEIRKVVDNLHQLGVEKVAITGGEPLLVKKKLRFLAELLTGKCIFFAVNTNAFVDIKLLLRIFKNNPYAERVQVSLDGNKEIHEKFRGRVGCYSIISNHVRQLVEHGINVKIVSMITRGWVGKEKEIFGIIKSLGVQEWLVEIPTKTGKWEKNYADYDLKQQQFITICRNFINLIKNNDHSLKVFSINQIYNWPEGQILVRKKLNNPVCFHDLGLFSFGPEGISFCTLFGDKFGEDLDRIAPAYTDDIKDVWNFIAKTRLAHKLKDNSCCFGCDLFEYCQGGCPGQYFHPAEFKGCDRHSKFLAEIKRDLQKSGFRVF